MRVFSYLYQGIRDAETFAICVDFFPTRKTCLNATAYAAFERSLRKIGGGFEEHFHDVCVFLPSQQWGKFEASHGRIFTKPYNFFLVFKRWTEKTECNINYRKIVSTVNKNCSIIVKRKIVFHLNIFQLPEDNEVTDALRIFRSHSTEAKGGFQLFFGINRRLPIVRAAIVPTTINSPTTVFQSFDGVYEKRRSSFV